MMLDVFGLLAPGEDAKRLGRLGLDPDGSIARE